MKVLKITLAAIASMAFFASCSNDNEEIVNNKNVKVEKTFKVKTTLEAETRTTIVNYNNPDAEHSNFGVHWVAGDKINIFTEGDSRGDVFTLSDFTGNSASFTGKTYDTKGYWAIYPAQANARLESDGKLTFKIPTRQKAVKNNFDPAAAIQIGHINGAWTGEIDLSNVCAFFSITVGPDCHGIVFTAAQSGWYLAGTVTADPKSSGNPISSFAQDCSGTIELTNIPQDGGTFLVSFIPTNGLNGISVDVSYGQDTGGPHHAEITTSLQCKAGHIYDWGQI